MIIIFGTAKEKTILIRYAVATPELNLFIDLKKLNVEK